MRSALSRTIADYRQAHGLAALIAEFTAAMVVAVALLAAAAVAALLVPFR